MMHVSLSISLCASLLLGAQLSAAATATRSTFGALPDGRPVEAVTLHNAHGMTVRILAYGALIQSVITPDRTGQLADIALGYPSLKGYLDKPQYFGVTVGRFANRIARGKFSLDGHTYQVPLNDGPNSLHGGTEGFDKVLWTILSVTQRPVARVSLQYVSPDGDQGYPGTLTAGVTYSLDDSNRLSIVYRATTDKATVVNLSNHAYWNLSGEGSGNVMGERLMIPGRQITPVDATLIPSGVLESVAGTPFDFSKPKAIGKDIRDGGSQQLLFGRGYDMNWVISQASAAKPRLVARVMDPKSGRVMELESNQPGLQFYSGNFLDGTTVGKSGQVYRQGDAFVLEPQLFPDTPNHPNFPSARLAPGEEYCNQIVYRFATESGHGHEETP